MSHPFITYLCLFWQVVRYEILPRHYSFRYYNWLPFFVNRVEFKQFQIEKIKFVYWSQLIEFIRNIYTCKQNHQTRCVRKNRFMQNGYLSIPLWSISLNFIIIPKKPSNVYLYVFKEDVIWFVLEKRLNGFAFRDYYK